jgi:predicted DNA-binding transcriptional regulator AlpA
MPHFGEEMNMAKRKADPSLAGQLDMFGDTFESINPKSVSSPRREVQTTLAQTSPANDILDLPSVANDILGEHSERTEVGEVEVAAHQIGIVAEDIDMKSLGPNESASQAWVNDEWWTTAMVCAYLQLGRKAIWERQRDVRFQFPPAFHFGTMRHRWRYEDVKAWAKVCR